MFYQDTSKDDDDDANDDIDDAANKKTTAKAPTPAPVQSTKKKGLFFQLIDDSERLKEEAEMKKRNEMNEIYTRKLREKAEKEAQLKEKMERDRD